MGYSPAVIGLLCPANYRVSDWWLWLSRRAAEMARQAVITVVAGAVCCQRHCDWAAGFISHVSLVEILIPFCVMAIANGAIYPIVVARALRPFHTQLVAPQRCRTLFNWVCASSQVW